MVCSGIVDGLDALGIDDDDECLFPTVEPAVEGRVDGVSTFSADFALATMPLLKDDLT